jgi:cytochrome oxidase Cu insertion factor (SCO1/SenC/PrrC family)
MKLSPRAKLLLLVSIFAVPMVASYVASTYFRPEATANYGELLLPPATITAQPFAQPEGGDFRFEHLRGKWVMVASGSGECDSACRDKLQAMNQTRLALGRNASRVEKVFVVDDVRPADFPALQSSYPGLRIVVTPRGLTLPTGAANDRAHIYLVDPRGNVMMRWPGEPQYRRMFRDLERLLKASQIG